MRPIEIGNATLYHGDCLEILPTLTRCSSFCAKGEACSVTPDGRCLADGMAAITDPPYGISFGHSVSRKNRKSSLARDYGKAQDRGWMDVEGDDRSFDPSPWLSFRQVVLWGGNHFADKLPASPSWLVWDKRNGSVSDNHSDCEMAWTNLGGPARLYRHLWRGVVRAGEDNCANSPKYHPCQKPIELMRWVVSKTTGVVVDGYMGSGTTGVACMNLGRSFVGIELNKQYFDIACERIENAQRQVRMFA